MKAETQGREGEKKKIFVTLYPDLISQKILFFVRALKL